MASRNTNSQHSSSRAWPVIGLMLATIALCLAGRLSGIENWFYDSFQRYQNTTANNQIVLVAVDSRLPQQKDIWTDRLFGTLISKIDDHAPKLIAATQPLALTGVPGAEQLRALEKLQITASRSQSLAGATETLSLQLARYQSAHEQRMQLVNQLQGRGNTLLAAMITDFSMENSNVSNCAGHTINLNGTEQNYFYEVNSARHLAVPPKNLCAVITGLGFNEFWPDADGVVRHASLVLNADGKYLPSLALAALAINAGQSNNNIVAASPSALLLNNRIINTGAGFEILNRYYASSTNSPAFTTILAADVLNDKIDPGTFRDKLVLIGETAEAAMTDLSTPVNGRTSQLALVATSLSNLLDGSYLLRPDWLPLAETIALFVFVALLALTLPVLTTFSTILLSFILGLLIVSIEAWILLTESTWIQLTVIALMTIVTIWTLHIWHLVTHRPAQVATQAFRRASAANRTHKPSAKRYSQSEMDLEFSLLREKAPTAETKEKMYDLAQQNLRQKEFARAERVLTHIHELEPGYRDVQKILDKLGASRKQTPQKRKAANLGDGPDRRTLGRYEIDRVLGRGAMATVYLGRDPKINRKVAIKTIALAKEFDDAQLADARLQFRREAESAGRLNHPNIIAIYDAGEDAEISYLAMEYFEGVSLVTHVKPGKLLPAKWVLELGARAAEALNYAHRQNVVHRDVKPANLMYNAATDALKLTDFGIARLTDNSRTKTGIILGTPSYMAPEQLTASGVTGKSDLYSLGVTIYQLIAGRAPFQADSIPKLMNKIMHEPHQPLCEIRNDVPACVDMIVNKSMAKNAADRFSNGQAMAMALRDCAKTLGS
jgi:CHASE2 domain-containing sensor protein/tRNA A-37 threonylcarbamoyl transferase component Bud32